MSGLKGNAKRSTWKIQLWNGNNEYYKYDNLS